MQEISNDIFEIISSTGYQVINSGRLKKARGKSIDAAKFYNEHIELFPNINRKEFEQIVKKKADELKQESIVSPNNIAGLLQECHFIYAKFRWFVTKDRTKIYYEKTREDAEEYKILTTDRESLKFFNCLNDEELTKLSELVFSFNMLETSKDIQMSEEKLVKFIMEDLRRNPAFRLEQEPITLSNNPTEPCFKFFPIKKLKKWGDDYLEKHGERPPTPAWDQFFNRLRDKNMIDIVKAFLTGIFIAKNKAKQCLYIWGAGNDGKSQITHAIATLMGDDVTFVLDQYMRSNQFSSYDAYGKRLCVGEEMSAPNLLKNKTFHAITGQSLTRIEGKGEQAFYSRLYACALVTSNEKPFLEDVKNQTTRLLYVEVDSASDQEINDSGVTWGKTLAEELHALIYSGISLYKKYNPDGGSYRMPASHNEAIEALFDDEAQMIDEFVHTAFEACDESNLKDQLHLAFQDWIEKNFFADRPVPQKFRDNQIARKIKEKLKIKFPDFLTSKKRLKNGTRPNILIGIKVSKKFGGFSNWFDLDEN